MKTHALGIDLGTSNCAMSLAREADVLSLDLEQAASPDSRMRQRTLPSSLFLPLEGEFPEGSFSLPWDGSPAQVVGQAARDRGALAPDRQIHSAKSWLCHSKADRKAPILPWQSAAAVEKLSPVDSSRLILEHLKQAFFANEATQGLSWEELQGIITLPASFDEAARALTLEAAQAAGFLEPVLLEEPQAAFYAWIENNPDSWRKQVEAGDLILVCDVGGGTADFSLIAVSDDGAGQLALERLSVGEHILLGGDNLDLALAHALKAGMESEGTALDDWQFLSLIHSARSAKEQLFSDPDLQEVPISIAGRGSSLFASTLSTSLQRSLLLQIAVEGFLPMSAPDAFPAGRRATALREFGLPYAADAAISKHLARFLSRSLEAVSSHPEHRNLLNEAQLHHPSGLLLPSAILFNGGFFKAAPLRERVEQLLASWNEGLPPRVLQGAELDLSVSSGAAAFGRQLIQGEGLRIKSATARAYYLGLESGGMAIPGFTPPVQALCICPIGLEEGSGCEVSDQDFGLIVGEAAEFRFFSSDTRGGDQPGSIISNAEQELEENSCIEVTLPPGEGFENGDLVPVRIESHLSEVGSLELRMRQPDSPHSWQLQFNTRS